MNRLMRVIGQRVTGIRPPKDPVFDVHDSSRMDRDGGFPSWPVCWEFVEDGDGPFAPVDDEEEFSLVPSFVRRGEIPLTPA